MKAISRLLVTVLALMLMTPAAAADQGRGHGGDRVSVVPATNVAGNTGGELVRDWYAQNLALPADQSPFAGAANLCLDLGRRGKVLAPAGGLETNGKLEMTCKVEVGRPVVLVMTSADCSSAEPGDFHAETAVGQRACVVKFLKGLDITSITVSVDGGRPVDIHSPRFFAVSPQGHVTFPENPVFGAVSGPATFVAAAWIAEIKGMDRGTHDVVGTLNIVLEGKPVAFPFFVHFVVK